MGNNLFGVKKKVGFTCSSFDLLHAGHILMLKDAKEQCDYLIVGLQTDPTLDRPEKNKPIQSLEERKIQLDYMTIDNFTGCNYNIPIYYHDRNHNYSSSNLREKILKKA